MFSVRLHFVKAITSNRMFQLSLSFQRLKDHIQNVSHNQVNVFLVDWSQVANHYSYSSCIANLPVLGDSLAYFIERLLTRFQIEPKNLHLISHSLGCHLAAYTGQRLIAEGLKIGNLIRTFGKERAKA